MQLGMESVIFFQTFPSISLHQISLMVRFSSSKVVGFDVETLFFIPLKLKLIPLKNLINLNSIENLWIRIKKKVSTSNPTTLDELKRTIKEIWWKDIDQNVCKNLTISMPTHIQKAIKIKGYHTNISATTII